jgi:uncharacterized membrane protein
MNVTHYARTLFRNIAEDEYFFDLKFLLLLTVGALIAIYVPLASGTVLRVLFTIPLILFIPGYGLISLLFPSKEDISPLERIFLAFGMSFVLAALIGLMLNYTPWGIQLGTLSAVLTTVSWFALIFAYYRRALLDPGARFAVSFRRLVHCYHAVITPVSGPEQSRFLSRVLTLSIILAIGTTMLVMAVPKDGEKFSEFYILGKNGEAVQYPQKVTIQEPEQVIIGIGNHEYRDVRYVIEVYAINQNTDAISNITRINSMELLDRFSLSLKPDQELERSYTYTVNEGGFNRIELLLFKDEPPSDDIRGMERIAASYRDLHIWVDVAS